MRLLLVMIFISIASILSAQHTITGKVVDAETGEGLIGAHIYLLKDWRTGTIAGLGGEFNLQIDNANTNDSLIISYVGFREKLVAVDNNLLIKLQMIEVEGETVTVTAKPLIAEEFQYMEIKKIDIYTNPSAKADPILAVNSLPSATTTDESANISLRGSSPVETGIFMNNVPVYDAVRYSQLNGIGTFSIFNTAIIGNVTVFPGNPPLEFGNVTSGIISMETDETILEGNTNSFIASLAAIGYSREQKISKNQSLKLFSNWQPSGAIKAVNPEALEDIESFTSYDLGAYWYGSNDDINWKVLSYSNVEGYQFNFEHPSFEGIFDQNKIRSFLISSASLPVNKGELTVNNGLSFSNGEYAYSNVEFEVDKRDLFGGLNYHLDDLKYSFKTGLSYDQRYSKVNGDFHEFGYALGPDHPTINVNESLKIKTLESFLYFKYYLTENIALGIGTRKNIPMDSLDYLSRQANMSYNKGKWSTTFGIGKYHKTGLFENTGEFFHAKSKQLSLDLKYNTKDFKIALSLFDKNASVNNTTYSARGLEFYSALQLSSKFTASGSITLLDANDAGEGSYQYNLNYFVRGNVAYSPGKFWTIESILNVRQGTLFNPIVSASFDSELDVYQPVYSNGENRLPDYWNVGLSVSKIFLISEDLNIIAFTSFNNVFNHENLRGYDYSEDYAFREASLFSQRTGYVGVIVNF